jgi:hypothetical protein
MRIKPHHFKPVSGLRICKLSRAAKADRLKIIIFPRVEGREQRIISGPINFALTIMRQRLRVTGAVIRIKPLIAICLLVTKI